MVKSQAKAVVFSLMASIPKAQVTPRMGRRMEIDTRRVLCHVRQEEEEEGVWPGIPMGKEPQVRCLPEQLP